MVTQLIAAHREGDEKAGDRLFAVVYDELHAMARRQLRFRKPGETLNSLPPGCLTAFWPTRARPLVAVSATAVETENRRHGARKG